MSSGFLASYSGEKDINLLLASHEPIEIMRQNIAALIRATVKEMFQNPAWLATPVDGEELFAPSAHAPVSSPATAGTQPAAEDLSASVS